MAAEEVPVESEPPPAVRQAPRKPVPCLAVAETHHDYAYPRDAIRRGIDSGAVVVRFTVDGDRTEIVSVTSSDRAFENLAIAMIRDQKCHSDRPVTLEVPLTFHRE